MSALYREHVGKCNSLDHPPELDFQGLGPGRPAWNPPGKAAQEAQALATDAALKQSILLKSVQVLMQGGLDSEARATLDGGLTEDGPVDATRYRLELLQGQLEERAGKRESAERIYRQVLEGALELPDTLAKETALMLARTAGLRLSNLYREIGQDRVCLEHGRGVPEEPGSRLNVLGDIFRTDLEA